MTAVRQFSTILFALLPFAPLAACGGASSEDPDAGDQTPASDTDSGASLEDGSAMSAPSPSPNHADGGARTDASTDAGFPSTDATAPHPPDGGSHLDSGTPPPVDAGLPPPPPPPYDAGLPPPPPPPYDAGLPPPPPPPIDAGSGGQCVAEPARTGGLTQYDETSLGNCGVPWPGGNTSAMFAAMSTADFDSPSAAAACGKCVQITGPTGMTATIPVYDQCPTSSNPKCVNGHIDLSHAAFAAVVPGNYQYGGEVPNDHAVAWKYVACPVNGPIVYHFKDGVNAGWIAVQVRNARAGIRTIRYRKNGQWIDMTPRTDQLAYFIVQGLNATTIDLQAVDEFGHVLEDDGVAVNANSDVNGHAQFPACP